VLPLLLLTRLPVLGAPDRRRPRQSLPDRLRSAPPEPTELWLALTAVCWGAWLLNPWVSTFASSPSYRGMAAIASEPSWGVLICGLGVAQLVGLVRRDYGTRMVAAGLGLLLWSFLAASFGLTDPATAGLPTYAMIALAASFTCLRLGAPRWS
jgi:hypothetical protein